MISTNADTDRAARRIFRKIFLVERRPGGVFVLKSKKTGKILGAGFTGKRGAELPLEEHRADPT